MLQHQNVLSQEPQANFLYVDLPNFNAALLQFYKSQNGFDDRGLPRPGLPPDPQNLPPLNPKIDTLQANVGRVGVPALHLPELNFTEVAVLAPGPLLLYVAQIFNSVKVNHF